MSEVGCGGVREEVSYGDAPCIRNISHINRIPPAVKFHILMFDQPHFFQLPQEPDLVCLSIRPSRSVGWSVGLSIIFFPKRAYTYTISYRGTCLSLQTNICLLVIVTKVDGKRSIAHSTIKCNII